ncbi:MAG: hypothetical protein PVI57_10630 [Gemmatimonadota bacterium]|jgi:hypothetical protein
MSPPISPTATLLLVVPGLVAAGPLRAGAQLPTLPEGARTRWVVEDPEEVVGWVTFDPTPVADRLPSGLQFVTVGELAADGVPWAGAWLEQNPARGRWGVSFLEIVRAGTFILDGRSPERPEDAVAALWFARIGAAEGGEAPGPGLPLLVLGFWMPDAAYASFMRSRGHPAAPGRVTLRGARDGTLTGTVRAEGLVARVTCTPSGPVRGGPGSRGRQVIVPPAGTGLAGVVRVAFAGHRERSCREEAAWSLEGEHPLVGGVFVGPATLQYGYRLVGGAYDDADLEPSGGSVRRQ